MTSLKTRRTPRTLMTPGALGHWPALLHPPMGSNAKHTGTTCYLRPTHTHAFPDRPAPVIPLVLVGAWFPRRPVEANPNP
eukprot:scaffold3105_cov101-Isochrysis_galbana.AAC.2